MKRNKGFTLIEVLVALVIIAYVGLSTQQRIGQFADDRSMLIDRHSAHSVAWNELMKQYQMANDLWANGDKRPEERDSRIQLGREWHYSTERQATLSDGFFRFETSIAETPFKSVDLENGQQTTANLVMFLVVK